MGVVVLVGCHRSHHMPCHPRRHTETCRQDGMTSITLTMEEVEG